VSGNFLRAMSSVGLLALLAACSSTDTSGMLSGLGTKKQEVEDPNKPIVVQGACPQVYLREGTAVYRQYAKGAKKMPDGSQDPEKLVIQATLDQTTRQCLQTDQGLRITVVVHGRIVAGPAGRDGTYTLPIRIAATDGDVTTYSELNKIQVNIPPGQGSNQFVISKDNVILTAGATGLTRLFAGIDEGPYNTK
jgi:hypothetical protein